MSDKAITRRLKIYVNGEEVDATITNLRKNLAKFRAQSNRAVEGSDKWKKYNKEVAKTELELKQATAAQKAFRTDTQLSEKSIKNNTSALTDFSGSLSSLFSGLKSGDFLQVQEGFRGVKTGIKGAAKAGLAFIATPIGAAIAVLVGVGLAAKAWLDYNTQVIEALRLTRSITGLTDKAGDDARIRAEALAETFDVDFKETLETANALAKQFGISFEEAFDTIEGQLVRGQKHNDEFFQNLKEYPTFFKQAGFSADEFGKVIAKGYDLGVYKDKLPDALKEADLAIKEQTKTTKDALVNAFGSSFTDDLLKRVRLGEITTKDALAEISKQADKTGLNVQQNAQLTADLFKGAGEDAGGAVKVLAAVNAALNENQDELTESEQLLQDQVTANTELKQVMSSLFATGDKGFGLWIDKAKLFGTKILVNILKTGVDVYNWVVDLNNESAAFSGILRAVGISATATFKMLGILLSNTWDAVKGLGTVFEGLFTLDSEKIKKGFSEVAASSFNLVGDLADQAVKNVEKVKEALSGDFKLERKSLDDFTADDSTKTTTTTTTTPTKDADKELTDADKKIIASKKKLKEWLDKWNEDNEIQKEIEDLEKDEAAQLKEELELENKFLKLEEQANGEATLLADLEEAKNTELDNIKQKWNDKFQKDNIKNKKEEAKEDKKFKQLQIDAENNLQNAKADALFAGLGILKSFAKEGSAAYKALFAVEKIAAAAEVVIHGVKERAMIAGTYGAMPAVSGPLILASKIRTGIGLATIAATTIKGFEQGGYTHTGSYSGGEDGRGGQLSMLHPNEYVIPQPIMQMPEVPRIVEYLEAKRTGQEVTTSEIPTQENNSENSAMLGVLAATVNTLNEQLANGLKIKYGLEDEESRRELAQKLDDTLTASKN